MRHVREAIHQHTTKPACLDTKLRLEKVNLRLSVTQKSYFNMYKQLLVWFRCYFRKPLILVIFCFDIYKDIPKMDTGWVTLTTLKLQAPSGIFVGAFVLFSLYTHDFGSTSYPCWCPSVTQSELAEPHPDVACNDNEVAATFEPYVRVTDPGMLDKDRTPSDGVWVWVCVLDHYSHWQITSRLQTDDSGGNASSNNSWINMNDSLLYETNTSMTALQLHVITWTWATHIHKSDKWEGVWIGRNAIHTSLHRGGWTY